MHFEEFKVEIVILGDIDEANYGAEDHRSKTRGAVDSRVIQLQGSLEIRRR